MTATDVLARHGTRALLRFTSLILIFTGLHLARLPFLALARGLGAAMTTIDTALSTPPRARTTRQRRGDRWGEPIPTTRHHHSQTRGRARAGYPDYGPAHHPEPPDSGVRWPGTATP
ncbi:hypothetical protein ATK36_3767 [Amycolatopsis sulphurea]|uniref:Uncharacterized protein n=1 Tax=Amycolatopsis sulphurea TaxID=76022 RepID=A0A2A9FE23_9PSEU|nr:hypothetical protein [Amycolatopsis sulphurea]PFG48665.1 hypothetical protein ATK36_3767 [Amycolatopsis sulphurea]